MAEDKFEQAVIERLKSKSYEYPTDYFGVTVDRLYASLTRDSKCKQLFMTRG